MTTTRRAALSFRNVLSVREFRWLWLADVQSLLGDQLARVAVSVIAYDATNSGFVTSAVYGLTFLPAVVGTPLGVLADRLPRRALLVAGDLARAGLLAVMALPMLPWQWLVPLVTVAVVVGAPWKAAESALVADILSGEGYVLGSGVRLATGQGAQLVGFATGGAVVGLLGAHAALAIDAATFLVSALLVRAGISWRPAAADASGRQGGSLWTGVNVAWQSARLRSLVAYAWLGGAFVVPEGLAAPVAAHFGAGPLGVGLLLACMPAGLLASCLTFVRWVPAPRRRRAMRLLAPLAGLPLLACAPGVGLVATCVLWVATGAAMVYQLQAMTDFVQECPEGVRGQAIAFASSGLLAVQGLGLVAGGAVAQLWSPLAAIGLAGVVGSALAVLTGWRGARTATTVGVSP